MAIRVQKKEKHYEAINVYRSRPAIGSVREARPRFISICFSLFIVVWISLNTIIECSITNACHAVGYGDGGKA